MAILRESPWYNEILQEGLQLGIEQGIQQGIEQGRREVLNEILRKILEQNFQTFLAGIIEQLTELSIDQLRQVVLFSLKAPSLSAVEAFLPSVATNIENENHNGS
jgi:predicted transposase YdaD